MQRKFIEFHFCLSDSDVHQFFLFQIGSDFESGYNVFDVYNPSFVRGGKLNITQIGHWSESDGFMLSTYQSKIERRHDLNQIRFHAATAVNYIKNF